MHATAQSEGQTKFSLQPQNGNGRKPFSQLLEQYEYPQPRRGDILQGEIIRIQEDVLFVDVGAKRDALVPHEEVEQLDDTLLNDLSKGDEVPVYVTRTPIDDEHLIVSLERGLQQLDWERAEALYQKDELLELKVVKYNKGGLVVEFGRLQGFVPNSHLPPIRLVRNTNEQQQYKAKQIGKTLMLKIIEVNEKKERLILSGTAGQAEKRRQLLHNLHEGDVVNGHVVNIKDYGAFVDIGHGLIGLLHRSKISWDKVSHPTDILTVGEEVEVLVEDIELERERFSLNRKALMPSPWQKVAADYDVGDLVAGVITAVIEYGAFVRLACGVEGLLHQNEMNLRLDSKPSDILQLGDDVLVRIVSLEADRERLSLSMRQVSAADEMLWMANNGVEVGE